MTSPHIQVRDRERERLVEIGRGIARAIIEECNRLVDAGRVPVSIVLHPEAAQAMGAFFAFNGFGGRRLDTLAGIPINEGATGGEPVVIVTENPKDVIAREPRLN